MFNIHVIDINTHVEHRPCTHPFLKVTFLWCHTNTFLFFVQSLLLNVNDTIIICLEFIYLFIVFIIVKISYKIRGVEKKFTILLLKSVFILNFVKNWFVWYVFLGIQFDRIFFINIFLTEFAFETYLILYYLEIELNFNLFFCFFFFLFFFFFFFVGGGGWV